MISLLKIWGLVLIVASAWLALNSENDYRAERLERCAVVRCI